MALRPWPSSIDGVEEWTIAGVDTPAANNQGQGASRLRLIDRGTVFVLLKFLALFHSYHERPERLFLRIDHIALSSLILPRVLPIHRPAGDLDVYLWVLNVGHSIADDFVGHPGDRRCARRASAAFSQSGRR